MFERALAMAKAISDGEQPGSEAVPFGAEGRQRTLVHAVLGLQARVEQLEETNERLYEQLNGGANTPTTTQSLCENCEGDGLARCAVCGA